MKVLTFFLLNLLFFHNRTKKHVIVNGSAIVPYDHLILATGLQYYIPAPTKADVYNGANNDSLPQSPDLRYNGPVPTNLFLVNDSYDAAVLLYRAEQLMKANSE